MKHAIQEGIFAELYSKRYKQLVAFAYRWTERWEDAEDIVSNLFLKVPPKMTTDQKRSISTVSAFFFVCTRNACLNYRNHNKSIKTVYDSDLVQLKNENQPDTLPTEADDADKAIISKFFEVQEIFHSLPAKSVYILRQIYLNNATTSQLAEQLNLATQTVLNLKAHAINNIRKIFSGQYYVLKTDKVTRIKKRPAPKEVVVKEKGKSRRKKPLDMSYQAVRKREIARVKWEEKKKNNNPN